MHIEKTIFFKNEWRWSKFQKYIVYKLDQYDLQEYKIPSEYSFKKSTYGSKKNNANVIPEYSVLKPDTNSDSASA